LRRQPQRAQLNSTATGGWSLSGLPAESTKMPVSQRLSVTERVTLPPLRQPTLSIDPGC
jgi:hypothetical protein